MEEDKKIIRIDVSGLNDERWNKFKSTLLDQLITFMETELDPIKKTTIKDELEQFTNKLLEYAKARLNAPVLNNEKTIAEIEELYSRKLLNTATARNTNAEAETKELKNKIIKLKILLASAKFVVTGRQDHETITFMRDIDQFLLSLKTLELGDAEIT